MKEYVPNFDNDKRWKCLDECPNGIKGAVYDVVMLGSTFCRKECKYSMGGKMGESIRCTYDEKEKTNE